MGVLVYADESGHSGKKIFNEGSLAKLQLGFTLQIGVATETISAIRTLGTASSPAMASVSGWGSVLGLLAGKMRGGFRLSYPLCVEHL